MYSFNIHIKQLLIGLVFAGVFALPALAAVTAPVNLTQVPLATSSPSIVKPNLLLVLDNSGSMDWDHMPDDASDGGSSVPFSFGFYGLRSSQCNQVYYDPTFTYTPPIDAARVEFSAATFTAAKTDGFNSGSGTVNLDNAFKASQSLSGDAIGQSAYYYVYSGAQTTQLQKNYNNTSNTFYAECHSALGSTPGSNVFSKRRLATTETTTINVSGSSSTSVSSIKVNGVELMSGTSVANSSSSTVASNIAAKITMNSFTASASGSVVTITGPTSAANFTPVITQSGSMTLTTDVFPDTTPAKLTNFANWYSFYRTRMLMMKTSTGRAFGELIGSDYRVGLMKISNTGTPDVENGIFTGSKRTSWYNTLYGTAVSGSTPLRRALSEAGRYYGGQLGGTDPIQYSCQQNFSIMSTDGYWNAGDGYKLNGSDAVGNQDGAAARPMYDGAQAATTVTTEYTQISYSKVRGFCSGGQRQLSTQPQSFSCSVTNGIETCGGLFNVGAATLGACGSSNSIVVPSPNPSARVAVGTPLTTTGSTGGTSDNLADIAMYYYQSDLRPGTCTLCEDNVFKSGADDNEQQHMTTYTLGLGASGWMNYTPTYNSANGSADFNAVKLGSAASATNCTWQAAGTSCNWPEPGMSGSDGLIANIDDLWHAAVNGRGAYFSATNPETLSTGLSSALASINSRKGAGSAAATSTLNPINDNNFAFVASYTTVAWTGNLEARGINTDTGETNENALWCLENVAQGVCKAPGTIQMIDDGNTSSAFCVTPNTRICTDGVLQGSDCYVPVATACTGTLQSRVSATSDSRLIWTKGANATTLNNFKLAPAGDLNTADFSSATIATLSQWTSLDATQKANATSAALVNYLRGQQGNEENVATDANRLFRARDGVLGDVVDAQPEYVGPSKKNYLDTGYSAFKTTNVTRSGTLYLASNDGMVHAINASVDASGNVTSASGQERWAYVPSMVIPNMWKLADTAYRSNHKYYINASPTVADIYDSQSSTWKTILVGGLGAGGRGYYALDITDPVAPKLLWEYTSANDSDLGYSYGKPVVTKKADGTWVVLLTSGYNNTSPGDGVGRLYVLNANTGVRISKIDTTAGDTSVPSGLAQIADWVDEPDKNNTAVFVYGGDLLGNVWRFDINQDTVTKFARLCADSAASCSSPQPITTRPELASVGSHRIIYVGTGKYLESAPSPGFDDLADTQLQTIYAIKDDDSAAAGATPTAALINPRLSGSGMVQRTITTGATTRTIANINPQPNFDTGRGWYVNLPASGERQNTPAQLVGGTLIVPTIIPSTSACKSGGDSWLNGFDYITGGAVDATGKVSVYVDSLIVGVTVLYVADPNNPGQLTPVVGVVTSNNATPINVPLNFRARLSGFQKKRAIWRELIQ